MNEAVNEDIKREYHAADVERLNFLSQCSLVNNIQEKPASALRFLSSVFLVVGCEMGGVFYLLSNSLGYSDSLYASVLAIAITCSCAFGLAFSNANTTPNLSWFRKQFGYIGQTFCLLVFLLGLGLIANWRADGADIGLQTVVSGYGNMVQLPVAVTSVITLVSFFYLSYEMRQYFWPRFWGYRDMDRRYRAASSAWQGASRLIESSQLIKSHRK